MWQRRTISEDLLRVQDLPENGIDEYVDTDEEICMDWRIIEDPDFDPETDEWNPGVMGWGRPGEWKRL